MTAAVLTTVTAQVVALSAAVTAIGDIDSASLAQLAPAILAAQAASQAIETAITATDALIITSSVCGVVSGGLSPALAASLLAQLDAMQNLVILMTLRAYVGRTLFNLSNATG